MEYNNKTIILNCSKARAKIFEISSNIKNIKDIIEKIKLETNDLTCWEGIDSNKYKMNFEICMNSTNIQFDEFEEYIIILNRYINEVEDNQRQQAMQMPIINN